tara:strand:+ start:709 stop:1155 length:447 start_codon:yes stop_codon:yes gene_type:complete
MTTDITEIKKELDGFEEIDSPFDLIPGDIIKYITLKKGKQSFFTGGAYKRMGDNKVFLEDKGRIKSFVINIIDKDGSILYSSRIFVKSEDKCPNSKELEEYQKIIDNQQNIIEVMTDKLKNNKIIIEQLDGKNKKYEQIIKKLLAERS